MVSVSQAARNAMQDPYWQQVAYELGTQVVGKMVSGIKKKKKGKKANANNMQMVVYKPPSSSRAPVAINANARNRRPRISGMSGDRKSVV